MEWTSRLTARSAQPTAPSGDSKGRSPPQRQVSKWLGHSSFVLTLSTYADYIREDDTAAPNFTRPVATATDNVVDLERRKSDTA
jgi:hypothetical protein